MSNRSIPNLEERLKHASEARKSMLAKFKMSLVEGPAAIEKRQQRQTIAAARAARAVQREEVRLRKEPVSDTPSAAALAYAGSLGFGATNKPFSDEGETRYAPTATA